MSDTDLQKRIDAARNASADQNPHPARAPMARGLAMAGEFVCAILVGAGLGFGIDALTPLPTPIGMIVGTMSGFVAGVTMIVRHGAISAAETKNTDP